MPGRLPSYPLVCRAPHPDPRRARRGEIHGAEIGGSTVPMRFTGRTVTDAKAVQKGPDGRIRFTPSCGKCGMATEYEECEVHEVDAA